jgi:hypothetical protein
LWALRIVSLALNGAGGRYLGWLQIFLFSPLREGRKEAVMNTATTFINFSNHPSTGWGEEQVKACEGANILDVKFPAVPSTATTSEVKALAEKCVEEILSHEPTTVMVAGEMTLTCAVVEILKAHGVKVVSACSERVSVESVGENGEVTKTSVFRFVQFREYA